MNIPRTAAVAVAAFAAVVAAATFAACSDSTTDLPERKVVQIDPEGARAYHSPDRFPNVVTYCVVGGHRVILTTRDQNSFDVVHNDPSCGAAR